VRCRAGQALSLRRPLGQDPGSGHEQLWHQPRQRDKRGRAQKVVPGQHPGRGCGKRWGSAYYLNSNENKQHDDKLSAAWQELADDGTFFMHKMDKPLQTPAVLDGYQCGVQYFTRQFELFDRAERSGVYVVKPGKSANAAA
jgi:hypothetical protein